MAKIKRRNQVTCRCCRYSFPHRQTEECLELLYPEQFGGLCTLYGEEELDNNPVARGIHALTRRTPTRH